MIYADNAATTKLDADAFEEMKPYLLEEYGNASQPYSFSRNTRKAIAEARATIAGCINADPEEIFFTSGGTESDNWAVKGSAFGDYEHRATITSSIEHHAVLNACQSIQRLGFPVAYIDPNAEGVVTPDALAAAITYKTRLVSIMAANNEIGTIQPLRKLCEIAHEHGALFHTDAVQAVGHIPIDVKSLDIDMLSASAHKFNGPKGIGFLYIKKETSITPLLDGGAQEGRQRAGTENVAAIVGMAAALRGNCERIDHNQEYVRILEDHLITLLDKSGIEYLRNGHAQHLPGIISLSFKGRDGEALLHRLDLMGICVSTGSACDSKNTQISHVLQAIKLPEEYANGTIRISLGKNNNPACCEAIVVALKKILKKAIN